MVGSSFASAYPEWLSESTISEVKGEKKMIVKGIALFYVPDGDFHFTSGIVYTRVSYLGEWEIRRMHIGGDK